MISTIITAILPLLGIVIDRILIFLSEKYRDKAPVEVRYKIVKVRYKIVGSLFLEDQGFGICKKDAGVPFILVPMHVEIANKSMNPKYIRNINIVAYNNKNYVAEFEQTSHIIRNGVEINIGNNQHYSFNIDKRKIDKYKVEFLLHYSNSYEFNVLKIRYHDMANKLHEQEIYSSKNPIDWKEGPLEYKKGWIKIP